MGDARTPPGASRGWLQVRDQDRRGGSQMNDFVVGVAGSDHSRMALRWAGAAGDAAGLPVRAVESWIHPRSAMLPIAPVPVSAEDMDEQTQQGITAIATDTLASSAAVTTDVLRGPPVRSSRRSPPTACSCSGPARWLCRTPARLGEPGVRRVRIVSGRRGAHRPHCRRWRPDPRREGRQRGGAPGARVGTGWPAPRVPVCAPSTHGAPPCRSDRRGPGSDCAPRRRTR
jgi:hypothetical protein